MLSSIARLLVDLLSVRNREEAELQVEILALRHQLRVLQWQVRRPRWRTGDRMILATIIERLPKRRWSALLSSPETILRWHRELVRRKPGEHGGCVPGRARHFDTEVSQRSGPSDFLRTEES